MSGGLRTTVYSGDHSSNLRKIAPAFKIEPTGNPTVNELEISRALLSLFGVRFVGKSSNLFSFSWNGSQKEGYSLDEITGILNQNGVDISAEVLVEDEFAYNVGYGTDSTYRFKMYEEESPKYRLVKDSLVWRH